MAKLNKAEIEALAKHLSVELDKKHNTAHNESMEKIREWERSIKNEDEQAVEKIIEFAKSLGYKEGSSYHHSISAVRITEPVCPIKIEPKEIKINEHKIKQHIIIQQISATGVEDLIHRVEEALISKS